MNCLDCESHEVINDPDPNDWFCDDDQAVVCQLTLNNKQNKSSKYAADHNQYKAVAVSVRPYKLRAEAAAPEWCPKTEKG